MNGLLADKKGIVIGVSNNRSIGWAISEAMCNAGAKIAMTYRSNVWKNDVLGFAAKINAKAYQCDVMNDEQIDVVCKDVLSNWGNLDFVVYAPAFAAKEALCGRFLELNRLDFVKSMEVTCYGVNAFINRLHEKMNVDGSVLTLSYYGAEKVMRNYDMMGVAKAALEANTKYLAYYLGTAGIRANVLSAGPVRSVASYGIKDFDQMLIKSAEVSPLKKQVTLAAIAKSALYLLSDMSEGVTGTVHYVDNGVCCVI